MKIKFEGVRCSKWKKIFYEGDGEKFIICHLLTGNKIEGKGGWERGGWGLDVGQEDKYFSRENYDVRFGALSEFSVNYL